MERKIGFVLMARVERRCHRRHSRCRCHRRRRRCCCRHRRCRRQDDPKWRQI